MKRLKIFGIIACVGVLFAPAAVIGAGPKAGLEVTVTNTPLPVTVQPDGLSVNVSTVYQFAGYTQLKTTGDAGGVLGMNKLCTEFGALARMCTSREYWTTPGAKLDEHGPGSVALAAWIQPSVVGVAYDGGNDHLVVMDFSGAVVSYALTPGIGDQGTCAQWNTDSSGVRGTFLQTPTGGVVLGRKVCSDSLRVTCCAPANQ